MSGVAWDNASSRASRQNSTVMAAGQPPGEHIAAEPVHNGDQIDIAAWHTDIRDVRRPYLIGVHNGYVLQQIRVDVVFRVRFAGVGLAVKRFQSHAAHETADALAVYPMPLTPQDGRNLAVAQIRRLREQHVNAPHQHFVLCGFFRTVIHTGARYAQ
jgi:hypothetical protein